MLSPARSIEANFGPILSEPTIADGNATLTPAVLVTDLADPQHHKVRRIMVYNRDNTNDISILIKPLGASLTGLTVADGMRVPPYQYRQVVVSSALRIGIVGAAASVAYNAVITDI
jgi:hypothetical protein